MIVHTDFFGLKVSALPPDFSFTLDRNAEITFSNEVRKLILDREHRNIPDSYSGFPGRCRLDGDRDGSVFHYHTKKIIEGICPARFY